MGASESTARTNGTSQEEEDGQPDSGGVGQGVAVAAAAITAVGVAALGISRMLSDNQLEPVTHESSNSRTNNRNTRRSWSLPSPVRPFKMNTDGGCRPHGARDGHLQGIDDDRDRVMRGPSGYGGILRDHEGKWVLGFLGFIDDTYSLKAEFLGIRKGLLLLDHLGKKEAILESDCKTAVDWITKDDHNYSRSRRSKIIMDCWEIITECKRLVSKNKITVSHCLREFNKCADKLADMAIDKKVKYQVFKDVPNEIKHLV